ncbi:hypothetical protein ACVW0K_007372 [Streptomyces filamentosus]
MGLAGALGLAGSALAARAAAGGVVPAFQGLASGQSREPWTVTPGERCPLVA